MYALMDNLFKDSEIMDKEENDSQRMLEKDWDALVKKAESVRNSLKGQ